MTTNYSDLSDASLDILKTMDSTQFRVLIYHCLLMKKNTVDKKRQHVVDSERCLELFRRNKPNFLRRYVTMDETGVKAVVSRVDWSR